MTAMIEELAQVKSEAVAFGKAQEWLDSRWVQMNVNPPVALMTSNYGNQRTVNESTDIHVDSIVDGGEAVEWGGVNNRGDSYRLIAQGLIDSRDPLVFTYGSTALVSPSRSKRPGLRDRELSPSSAHGQGSAAEPVSGSS